MTNVFWKIQHEAPSSVQMGFNQTDLRVSASHMAISQYWNISVATSMTGTIVYRIQSALAIWKSHRLRKKMHNLLASHLLTTLFTTKSRTFCLRITYPWMAPRSTLFTLFTLFVMLIVLHSVHCTLLKQKHVCLYILLWKVRIERYWTGLMGFWAKCWVMMGGWVDGWVNPPLTSMTTKAPIWC